VRLGKDFILIDCGSGVVHRLVEAGISPGDVHTLLLTHLHSDHFIDLGHFLVLRWISGDDRPLDMVGPRGTKALLDPTLALLEADIAMRMKIRGEPRQPLAVNLREIDAGPALTLDGLTATAFDVEHYPLDQPFGYRFETRERVIVHSGDTCPSENLVRHAKGADLLVHECMDDAAWDNPQIDHGKTDLSHTTPGNLSRIATEAEVKLLVATHLNPGTRPEAMAQTIGEGFSGPIVIGEDLMTL
jgi:ribonuclease Z